MIRLAKPTDFRQPVNNETLLRIHALQRAYGSDVPFIQFYSDGEGSLLAIMDGVGFFAPADIVTEEWTCFLAAHPSIQTIHCPLKAASAVATDNWSVRTGVVMRYGGNDIATPPEGVCRSPYLPSVYALLSECFDGIQPFDGWYVDVSHRVRHGCCRIACICDGENIVSAAMTVAETEDAAILGQVATAPTHRRRGFAAKCVNDLLARCKDKLLYILPVDERAQKLYTALGFVPYDFWAELTRK